MDKVEKDFKYFKKCLEEAGKRIDEHYFQLDVADSDELIYRERVYCYELYHQLRRVLEEGFPYKLNGEVDKAGHPIIRERLGHRKPDFIVHNPGGMDENLVVIEVKSIKGSERTDELENDVKTLRGFIDKAKYFRGIMLIYGDDNGNFPENIISKLSMLLKGYESRVFLFWHPRHGEKLEEVKF